LEDEAGLSLARDADKVGRVHRVATPTAEQILNAFNELGTRTSVATFFGVHRSTISRWTEELDIHPELRPEIPISQLLSSELSDSSNRVKVAQWVADEASISVAYHSRYGTTALLVAGAMNDINAMKSIATGLGVEIVSGSVPQQGRLPMHVIRLQGARAYCLLGLVSNELTGLKALEANAALSYFPPSGIVDGKVTTDAYMVPEWRRFARETTEAWNRKRRNKLSSAEIDGIVESWILNRTARARRGLAKH